MEQDKSNWGKENSILMKNGSKWGKSQNRGPCFKSHFVEQSKKKGTLPTCYPKIAPDWFFLIEVKEDSFLFNMNNKLHSNIVPPSRKEATYHWSTWGKHAHKPDTNTHILSWIKQGKLNDTCIEICIRM